MRRKRLSVAFLTLGLTGLCTGGVAHALTTISFRLVPASAAVANCLPDAKGEVTVLNKEVDPTRTRTSRISCV